MPTRTLLIALLVTIVPSVAMAHPGHGHGGGAFTVLHYLTEPIHAMAIAGLLVTAAGVFGVRRLARVTR